MLVNCLTECYACANKNSIYCKIVVIYSLHIIRCFFFWSIVNAFLYFVIGSEKGVARLVILRKKQEMLWKIKQILMKITQKKHAKI